MTRPRKHRKGGRTTPKGTRPNDPKRRHLQPLPPPEPASDPDDEALEELSEDLFGGIREALDDESPIGLLMMGSELVEALLPDRFARDDDQPDLATLVDTLAGIPLHEATGILAALAVVATDDVARKRARVALAARGDLSWHPWLGQIGEIVPTATHEMVHTLGDGDNVSIGWRWPGGQQGSVIVYIDHNAGTVVKDAFVTPDDLDSIVAIYRRELGHDPDTTIRPLPPADARARVTEAIEAGRLLYPPFESETWPDCRPLVAAVVAKLPEGGTGYERPDWPEGARDGLLADFLECPYAEDLVDGDEVEHLVDALIWFGCDYGPGDPLRWSPTSVEIVLADWFPRKVMAPVAELERLPEVLRAFVRYTGQAQGYRQSLVDQTLEAVDQWEPDYLAAIRDEERPMGAEALARMVMEAQRSGPMDELLSGSFAADLWDDSDEWDEDDEDPWDELSFEEKIAHIRRGRAMALVSWLGGPELVASMDAEPFGDEPFDRTGVPGDLAERVAEILEVTDRVADEVLDVEYATMARRLLARIVDASPDALRRGRSDIWAAGILYALAQESSLFYEGGLTRSAEALAGAAGVKKTTAANKARAAKEASGLEGWHPDLLHSDERARLLGDLAVLDEQPDQPTEQE